MAKRTSGLLIGLAVSWALAGCQSRDIAAGGRSEPPGGPTSATPATATGPDHATGVTETPAPPANRLAGESTHTIGRPAADAAVTFKVKSALLGSKAIDGTKLDVEATADGAVTLKGSVPTDEQRRKAGEEARQIEGVRSVVNELRVAS